ncbi:MAG: presenilin family intramembrane aspartyl protease PSH [Candidatus Poseidoniaceae archaeon]
MSEEALPISKGQTPSDDFIEMERQLTEETSVLSLMKQQMTSMLGMFSMFIITIGLSLYIRPWYDVAELHAFGEAGASQVRYILLELVMIFIFTAGVIMLARYKKEWLIKYGIMGVLTIALMYTTVPLMHMLVIDFDVEEFEYQETFSYEGDYVTDLGMDGFLTHQINGNFTNWEDSISYYSTSSLNNSEAEWTNNFSRLPAGDNENLRIVKSQDHLTVTNTAWIWSIDIKTGTISEYHPCNYLDEVGNIQLGTTYGDSCDMALIVDQGVYVLSRSGDVTYYPVSQETGNMLAPQAQWALPSYVDLGDGFIEASQIDDDRLLLVTKTTTMVMDLRTSKMSLEPELMPIEFEYKPEGGITSADFGHSPWSDDTISMNNGNSAILIIGEQNGNVSGWEWDGTKSLTNQFTFQEKMNIDGLLDTVSQVQITDLDNSGRTDMLISSDEKSYWLHGMLLKNRLTFEIDSDFQTGIFGENGPDDYFYAVSGNEIKSGIVEDDMKSLDGLQLYDVPFLIGVIFALLLMILLYFHSEWYVVNTVGILVGAGVIVMLGVAFTPGLIIIFMILAAIYDAWAVYRSKHMLELADTMIGLQLPILLVAPQDKGYSFKDENSKMVDKTEVTQVVPANVPTSTRPKKKSKEALFMGLGDIIFPGMLVLSAVQWLDSDNSFAIAMFALIGSLIGYFALMTYVARGKAQAGLPLLNGGAIVGYLIGGLIFMGTEIFNLGISF